MPRKSISSPEEYTILPGSCLDCMLTPPKKQIKVEQDNRALWYNRAVKRELMEILACPVCRGELELTVEKEDEQEIVAGSLYCPKCHQRYPIVAAIPNLLPPAQGG